MHRIWYLRLFLLSAVVLLGGAGALAMMAPDTARSILFHQIEWQELSAEQQRILKPLAGKWATMKYTERERWRGMAERYEELPPAEQKRIQKRMRRWAATTSAQRQVARANYKKFKDKASTEKKQEAIAAWQNYATTQGLLEFAVDEPAAVANGGEPSKESSPPPAVEAGAIQQAQAPADNP